MTLTSANHLPAESDAHTLERIKRLREDAGTLISMASDLERTLPFPHEHPRCAVCEECRLGIVADAVRLHYT